MNQHTSTRIKLGLSKYKVAKALGISWNHYHLCERGERRLSADRLRMLEQLFAETEKEGRIANAFGIQRMNIPSKAKDMLNDPRILKHTRYWITDAIANEDCLSEACDSFVAANGKWAVPFCNDLLEQFDLDPIYIAR